MRVLVVENNPLSTDRLKAAFKAKCFAVDVARDGEQASYLARTNDYDIIILDLMLPKKSGLEVCKEIRKSGKTMPILVISGKSDTTSKVDLLNAGADDYMVKPLSVRELQARMRALLRRPEQIENEIITIDDLTLDVKKQLLTRGKKEIYLTCKEYALLEYLMTHQDTVLSRGIIMEHVWGMDADPFSNAIEAHIASLRRKIDSKRKNKLIHTYSGRGYKMSFQANDS